MPVPRTFKLATALLCVGSLAAGCGGSGPPPIAIGTLSGKVLLSGQAPGGECQVNFFDSVKGAGGLALTGADGTFTASLPVTPSGYKVSITAKEPEPTEPGVPRPKTVSGIPPKFRSMDTSGLTAMVKEGPNDPITYDLTK